MSYILSALKKVERKRKLKDTPELWSVQIEDITPDNPRLRRISIALSTISLAAVVVISGIWYHSTRLPTTMSATPKLQTVLVTPPTVDGVVSPEGLQVIPLSQVAPPTVNPTIQTPAASIAVPTVMPYVYYQQPTSPPANTVAPTAPAVLSPHLYQGTADHPMEPISVGIVNYNQLPDGLRNRIPNIQLSAHIYSDTRPQARKVIINGVTLREKQSLSNDLSVHQINSDGVVMDYQGTLFLLDKKSIFN